MIRKRLSYSRNRLSENRKLLKRKLSEKIDKDEEFTTSLDMMFDESLFADILYSDANIDTEDIDWSLCNGLFDDFVIAVTNTFFENNYPIVTSSTDYGVYFEYWQKIDEIVATIKNTDWMDSFYNPRGESWISFDGDCYSNKNIEKLVDKIVYRKYKDVDKDTLDLYVSAMFSAFRFAYEIEDIDGDELKKLVKK